MFRPWTLGLLAVALAGCAMDRPRPTPSDDPADYTIDPAAYRLEVTEPRWIVPSSALPSETPPQTSNNNLDLTIHEGRLYFAWRTNETHFASPRVKMYVLASDDDGRSFTHEHTIAIGADVREPRFVSIGGALHLLYFEGGVEMFAFEPKKIWRIRRTGPRRWSEPAVIGEPGEVPWDVKVRGGRAYMTSYVGDHYGFGDGTIDVYFKTSTDGISWSHVDPSRPVVYRGGVSEVAFELDADGTFWGITRNEDGDETGFGAHVCTAPASALAAWSCSPRSLPDRYDSPKMIRHGSELYILARRDVGGPFDQGRTDLSFADQRLLYLANYWTRPKRTAIYRLDKAARQVVHLLDLPSAGDTAYPAVRRLGPHAFLIGNYTSPLDDLDRSWVNGQTSPQGTQIYFVELRFVP